MGQGRDRGVKNFFWTQRFGLLTRIHVASNICKRQDQKPQVKLVGIRQVTLITLSICNFCSFAYSIPLKNYLD